MIDLAEARCLHVPSRLADVVMLSGNDGVERYQGIGITITRLSSRYAWAGPLYTFSRGSSSNNL